MACFHCGHTISQRQKHRQRGAHVCPCCFSHEQAVAYYGRDIVYWDIAKKDCASKWLRKRIYGRGSPTVIITNVIKRLVRQASLGNDLPDDFPLFTPLR